MTRDWMAVTHGNRAVADGDRVSLLRDSRGRLRGTVGSDEKRGAKEEHFRARVIEQKASVMGADGIIRKETVGEVIELVAEE